MPHATANTAPNDPSAELHVVFGTGPVGCWTARTLAADGHRVRVVNRSGRRPERLPETVEVRAADASDPAQAVAVAGGATTVVQAMNPPYGRWHELFPALQTGALAAAEATGARYVSIDNLYMLDASQPITESSRVAPSSKKGELRQRMAEGVLAAHAQGRVQATVLRSADYYGPGVTGSAWGERVFAPLVAGKAAQVTGRLDVPHSVAYIEDVGRAVALLATRDEALGSVWIAPHAPAATAHAMVAMAAESAGVAPKATGMGRFMMRVGGLFVPEARATVEMMHQFLEPFVVDAHAFERTFGLAPTPLREGMARTVAWYQARVRS